MEMIQAIKTLYPNAVPNADFIVQDDSDGNGPYIAKWDVKDAQGKPVPQPTEEDLQAAWSAYALSAAQAAKKAEVSAAVAAKITAGYQSTVVLASTGKAHFYGTTPDDQANMNFEYNKLNGNPDQATVDYRPQDELDFVTHTRAEFKEIAEAIYSRVKFYLGQGYAYYRQLDAATTVSEVEAIVVNIVDP
jgi:hypothetical protein